MIDQTNEAIWAAWKRGKASADPKATTLTTVAKDFSVTRNRVAGAVWRGRQREKAPT